MSFLPLTSDIALKKTLDSLSSHLGDGDNDAIYLLRLLGTVMGYAHRVLTVASTQSVLDKC